MEAEPVKDMKKIALIVAGGTGSRMNKELPKQFLLLKNKPVLYYTLKAFLEAYDDLEIILVLPGEHIGKGQEIIDGYFDHSRLRICAGGRTRFHSVQNGLALIHEESIVFVHDGVRCLITGNLIKKCYEAAVESVAGRYRDRPYRAGAGCGWHRGHGLSNDP